jgi:hypothetical protein
MPPEQVVAGGIPEGTVTKTLNVFSPVEGIHH